ncbi:tRNA pseudouridine(38-40) synthase TruA [Herpetosiphon llansteffanensis]
MSRTLALCFEYVGTAFCGSQWQPGGRAVQTELETAWQRLTSDSGRWIFAGRTDAGVHALAQVAHIVSATDRSLDTIAKAMNAITPADISVHEAWEMPTGFHARFSARQRTYRYVFDSAPAPSATLSGRVLRLDHQLDWAAMQAALDTLIGIHDFAAFAGAGHEGSTIRNCYLAQLRPAEWLGRPVTVLHLQANAFLKHMVRNIVGTLLMVGAGKLSLEAWLAIIASRDRRNAGPTAPPQGLYLESIGYDPALQPLATSSRWDGTTYFRTYQGETV